jgi:hypothetical protein
VTVIDNDFYLQTIAVEPCTAWADSRSAKPIILGHSL